MNIGAIEVTEDKEENILSDNRTLTKRKEAIFRNESVTEVNEEEKIKRYYKLQNQ